jgi:transcription elongation factor GreB
MSRAFVKEDDSGEPPIIAPRAALPAGTTNYVTPQGLAMLRAELSDLEAERAKMEANQGNEADRRRQLNIITARLNALTERLASARVIDPTTQPPDQVRFGASVTLRTRTGKQPGTVRQFTIVGVDEASVAEGRISFVSPLARTLIGATTGQTVHLRLGPSEEIVEVTGISYS